MTEHWIDDITSTNDDKKHLFIIMSPGYDAWK